MSMTNKILIIIGMILSASLGVYCLHWLFNIRDWIESYTTDSKQGKYVFRRKIISFLVKDELNKAPLFVYIIGSSLLLLALIILMYMGYSWFIL